MSFAGVGPAELLLILIVALLIFGPSKLPEVARDLGKAMQKWRAALDEITGDVLSEAPTSQPKETQMQESVQKVVEPTPDDAVAATDGTDEEEVDTECQT